MRYITNKRFKSRCLCGEINLPYGTECECINNLITYQGKPICYTTSQNAYNYFSCNEDGHGLERGKLVHQIQRLLAEKFSVENINAQDKHQARWDKIWDDEAKLGKFRRQDIPDHWLWGFEFYNANIEDLQYILNKILEVK